ncbi:MAG: hypothetical protein ABW175_07045, partial [Bradyrhizobium sp.]
MALQAKLSTLLAPPVSGTIPDTSRDTGPDAKFGDLRFRTLLVEEDWQSLPQATRRRFSKRLGVGETTVYAGEVVEVAFSRIGWLLAQLARL